ncbi:polyamine-modulated factor 1 isoform X2 [Cephus cinctus]|uniref:Polyamine-modulated factor 1 isoform X2 n=1 Tax=Cephus cinctus TaxID=211228 RepID=A0AAJ7BKE5_CEPCN|nr:polyamine-modulated factor 1 isoform X2 [Cephus cinctus]
MVDFDFYCLINVKAFKNWGKSEDTFIENFSIFKEKAFIARKLHKALITDLHKSMDAVLEEMLEDGSLVEALAMASRLSEKAIIPAGESAWRPPGNIEQHLRSLDAEIIQEQNQKLEELVNKLEAENEVLIHQITESRNKVLIIDKRMNNILTAAPDDIRRMQKAIDQMEDYINKLKNE